ncbi:MAG: stage V sporulation T C-terminal domain-containing protein [Clostridia bacterium]
MKATGIVRKIDDLGRIVIPKEIRKALRIRIGDPLEIYVERNGEIILKKYKPLGDLLSICEQYAEALFKTTGFTCCISDMENIIAASGNSNKDYLDKELSNEVINIMEDRNIWFNKNMLSKNIIQIEKSLPKYTAEIISPIICDGDAIGTVILFSSEYGKKITDVEIKLVQSASIFLGVQMGQ